jgi:cytochrome P450
MEAEVRFTPESLATPDVRADPYPAYRQLRPQSPFVYPYIPAGLAPGMDEPVMAWALMRYADVDRAVRDQETFSSARSPIVEQGLSPRLTMLFDDPPRHLRLRRLINYAFTARRVEALEAWMGQIAEELLDSLGSGEAEVMERFAVPLPMMVIARLLGIPQHDYRTFRAWSQAFVSTVTMPHEERQRSIQEMTAYFREAVRSRRARGADDLLTALAEARVDGEALEDDEILGLCIVLLIAGNETTVNLIGAMLNLLAERPDLWHRLREDRTLMPAFVEETLRFASPVQRMPRRATRPVEIAGVPIAQGEPVVLFFGAANRDPAAFADPDDFRLDRDPREHVAFGTGIHYCVGATLARTEARVALGAVLDRYSALEPGATPAVRQTHSLHVFGFRNLPLTLRPRC